MKPEITKGKQAKKIRAKKALVLFSGGIDSTTALYWALKRYQKVYPVIFDYGQRHRVEIKMAKRTCQRLGLEPKIIRIDLRQIGGSALTDEKIRVPGFKKIEEIKEGLPATYVPFRNGIFIALGAALAEALKVLDLVSGFNVIDSPTYPDTTGAFVRAMEKAINEGTGAKFKHEKFRIVAPFLGKKKSEIIRLGLSLGANYSYSVSCYAGGEIPCGRCSSCLLRARAWKEAGQEDHLLLRLKKEGKI
ncbi:MAG TPA: 7-cyano-7-deazaguanine synthase QueC [Candidatus Saccharicenans sp.]|jgi:7-cyano-7-deazaguanine synthase|nr:7-cyano-7-deazaguanine synthase QueC [Candidatus Saccharicenans sp.]HRD01350.1 7-cyano-7-deazaguanine synthase QueC [Candidatus Saccharicenans sp.]